MGVANTITSACCILSVMATASSSITHRPSVWQARQPRQNAMFLPRQGNQLHHVSGGARPVGKGVCQRLGVAAGAQARAEDKNMFGHIGFLLPSGLTLPL